MLNNEILLLTWGVVYLNVYLLLMNTKLDLVLLDLGLIYVWLLLNLLLKASLSFLKLLLVQLLHLLLK